MDSRDILTIKGLIRRGEARTASTYNQIPLNRVHSSICLSMKPARLKESHQVKPM